MILLLASLLSFSVPRAHAQEPAVISVPATAVKPAKTIKILPSNVLDFEGEVIEGERKRPDLFLQLSNTAEVDTSDLIYIRENFNDFLEVDKSIRPQFIKAK